MKQDNELLPCPFCGAPAFVHELEPHEHSTFLKALIPGMPDHSGSYVIEGSCECGSGLMADTREQVVAMWNRRAPDDRDARIAELEAAVQWAGWMPLDQAPQGELMLFCDMNATELRASFFVDWMVGGKFCGNRHHTATHCMKLPPAPTANAMQINDLGEKSANDTPTATPWYPDDSGEWVEVPEDLKKKPVELSPRSLIQILQKKEREDQKFTSGLERAYFWPWDRKSADPFRIVAYKVVKP